MDTSTFSCPIDEFNETPRRWPDMKHPLRINATVSSIYPHNKHFKLQAVGMSKARDVFSSAQEEPGQPQACRISSILGGWTIIILTVWKKQCPSPGTVLSCIPSGSGNVCCDSVKDRWPPPARIKTRVLKAASTRGRTSCHRMGTHILKAERDAKYRL